MPAILGELNLPILSGVEIRPGVILIGEPVAIPGSCKFRCLANAFGSLVVVELSITFPPKENKI